MSQTIPFEADASGGTGVRARPLQPGGCFGLKMFLYFSTILYFFQPRKRKKIKQTGGSCGRRGGRLEGVGGGRGEGAFAEKRARRIDFLLNYATLNGRNEAKTHVSRSTEQPPGTRPPWNNGRKT
jgi:hypothetical protein